LTCRFASLCMPCRWQWQWQSVWVVLAQAPGLQACTQWVAALRWAIQEYGKPIDAAAFEAMINEARRARK
jgi:NAD-dependent SIR2 family protein deacetylase